MKKNVIKSTFVVVLLAIAGIGGIKMYSIYVTNDRNDLLAQNIEALSNDEDSNTGVMYGYQIISDLFRSYCYQIMTCNHTVSDPYYDSREEKWYKNISEFEYVKMTTVYQCLFLNNVEIRFYQSHSIPLVECGVNTKTTCSSEESPTMPEGFNGIGEENGRTITWRVECPAP